MSNPQQQQPQPLDPDRIVGPTDGGALIGRSAYCISDWRRRGILAPTAATAGRFLYRVGDLLRVRDAQRARRDRRGATPKS